MKIKVKRLVKKDYDSLVERLGKRAEFVEIPATVPDISFKGVFTDALKQMIAIPWPIDRPQHAQKDFSETYCNGGWPVDFIERKRSTMFEVVK